MAQLTCSAEMVAGMVKPRRCVVLLDYPAPYMNAFAFNALSKADERYYQKSFDMWMDGFHRPKRYHGWSKGEFDQCYVFKHVDEAERLYGFLANPDVKECEGREVCVLVLFATKKRNKTDEAELRRVDRIRQDAQVQILLNSRQLYLAESKWTATHSWPK